MMTRETETWVLVETDKELCVVERRSIRSSADVEIGDRVSFNWTKSLQLTGIVKYICGK